MKDLQTGFGDKGRTFAGEGVIVLREKMQKGKIHRESKVQKSIHGIFSIQRDHVARVKQVGGKREPARRMGSGRRGGGKIDSKRREGIKDSSPGGESFIRNVGTTKGLHEKKNRWDWRAKFRRLRGGSTKGGRGRNKVRGQEEVLDIHNGGEILQEV